MRRSVDCKTVYVVGRPEDEKELESEVRFLPSSMI